METEKTNGVKETQKIQAMNKEPAKEEVQIQAAETAESAEIKDKEHKVFVPEQGPENVISPQGT